MSLLHQFNFHPTLIRILTEQGIKGDLTRYNEKYFAKYARVINPYSVVATTNATHDQITRVYGDIFDRILGILNSDMDHIPFEKLNTTLKIPISNKAQDFIFVDRRLLKPYQMLPIIAGR